MRPIVFEFNTASGQQRYVPEKSTTLRACEWTTGFVVSQDPSVTYAGVVSPSADGIRYDILAVGLDPATAAPVPFSGLSVKLVGGQTYFVSISATSGAVILFVD